VQQKKEKLIETDKMDKGEDPEEWTDDYT